jgi:hypothetical protein
MPHAIAGGAPPGLEYGHVGPQATVNRRACFPYLLLACGSAAYLYPFVRTLWRFGDEGTLVYGAQRVAEGAVPYRDFFEVMGPGSFYWLALFFKIFGTSFLVTRILLLLTGVATILLAYWLARRLRSGFAVQPAIFILAMTIPLWPATNHHWDSNLSVLLSFAAFVSWVDNQRRWLISVAGVLAGVTTLFMQQKGLLLLVSYLVFLAVFSRTKMDFARFAARLLAGYAAVLLALLLFFYSVGALPDLLYANVIWPLTRYENVNNVPYAHGLLLYFWKPWLDLLPCPRFPAMSYFMATIFLVPFLVVAGLPLLLVLGASLARNSAFKSAILPYWITGCALWLSEIHRKDTIHLIYGSPLLLILCFHLWQQSQPKFLRHVAHIVTVTLVLYASFHALLAAANQAQMVTRRGTIYTFKNDEALEFLDKQVAPRQYVFVYPYYPMYYFLSNTANPTRFSILMYHINTEAQFRETVAELEQKKVRYVLWDTFGDGENFKRWFPSYQQPPREQLIVEPYLLEHYDFVGYRNGLRLLQRKGTSGPTLLSSNQP